MDMAAQLNDTATKGNQCFGAHDLGTKGRTNVIGALLFGTSLRKKSKSSIQFIIPDRWFSLVLNA